MNKKIFHVFAIAILSFPILLVFTKNTKAQYVEFANLTATKFEQAPLDDLTDNVATINIELSATNFDFDQIDIVVFSSQETFQNTFNYDAEVGNGKIRDASDFVNGKLNVTLDVPLLFQNDNYLTCYIFDYTKTQYYDCSTDGFELRLTKISPEIPVYRFFNTKLGTHLYTSSEVEKNGLKDESYLNPNAEWEYEGYKYFVFKDAVAHPDTAPVYRFFNTKEGGHVYTTSEIEKSTIINTLPKYSFEGVKYYVVANPTIGFVPVYRFFNTKTGTHLYTINEDEKSTIMNTLPQYSYEGPKFHVLEN